MPNHFIEKYKKNKKFMKTSVKNIRGKNKIKMYKPIIIVEIWNNNKRNLERMQTTTDEIINYIINLGYKLIKQLGDNYIFLPKEKFKNLL